MNKYDHAKFIIERFDHYYDSVNNKGAFYIGLNTFIFGGVCVGYLALYNKIDANTPIWCLFAALIICNVLSIYFTVMALMPFLRNNYTYEDKPSLLYFGGIARHTNAHFKEKFSNLQEADMTADLVEQAYCLAIGLDGKYKKLKRASQFLIVQFIAMIPLLFLIVKNLSK